GEIAKLKADIRNETDPAKKANLESNLQQAEEFQKELQNMKPALPTRTVATTTTLSEGGRENQLHVLGRAHTNGQHVIYRPKAKVGDQLATKYEAGFSKYPLGRYRDRVGTNVEAVYQKVVKKA